MDKDENPAAHRGVPDMESQQARQGGETIEGTLPAVNRKNRMDVRYSPFEYPGSANFEGLSLAGYRHLTILITECVGVSALRQSAADPIPAVTGRSVEPAPIMSLPTRELV